MYMENYFFRDYNLSDIYFCMLPISRTYEKQQTTHTYIGNPHPQSTYI